MNMEKLKERMDSSEKVEELLILSQKVFGKNSDEINNIIEMFITKSYLMGKQNAVKVFDD